MRRLTVRRIPLELQGTQNNPDAETAGNKPFSTSLGPDSLAGFPSVGIQASDRHGTTAMLEERSRYCSSAYGERQQSE